MKYKRKWDRDNRVPSQRLYFRGTRPIPDHIVNKMRLMRREGKKVADIAAAVGVARETASRYTRDVLDG
jgi:hypothetical protein